MRERAVIHVGGPKGSGKTAFVEAIVGAGNCAMLTARCVRDAARRRARESSPRTHPELQRYLRAGADAAALFVFPAHDVAELAFYETELMLNYSESVNRSDVVAAWRVQPADFKPTRSALTRHSRAAAASS